MKKIEKSRTRDEMHDFQVKNCGFFVSPISNSHGKAETIFYE